MGRLLPFWLSSGKPAREIGLEKKDLEGGRKGTEPRQRIWEAGKGTVEKGKKNAVSAAQNLRCGTVDVKDK